MSDPVSPRSLEPTRLEVVADDAGPVTAGDLSPAPAPAPALDPTTVAERCAWTVVWIGTLIGGIDLWGAWSSWVWAGYLAPAFVAVGIAGMASSWLVRTPRSLVFQLLAFCSVAFVTLSHQAVGIHTRKYYSTDSGAFNQVAAKLAFHGHNPYTTSMAAASKLLQYPLDYWTYTVNGGHVSHVSYPAGSFLLEVPALALGFRHEIADWIDLYAWVLTVVLLFALLPKNLRWFPGVVLIIPIFSGIFASGGTDAVFLPFLVVAVWQWDRFCGGRGMGAARWIGPVALGLACATKQTPWFLVPFLLVGVFVEAMNNGGRPFRRAGAYLAIVVGIFLAVNLPYILWAPRAWVRGTLLPFTHPLVIDGQGLATLALHGVVGGVSLSLLTLAGGLVYLTLLVAFVVWYPQMKRIWLILLPLTFFVSTRSLSSYLIDFLPLAVLAVVSVAPGIRPAFVTGRGRFPLPFSLAAVAAGVAAVGVAVAAFASAPLQLDVRSTTSSHTATKLDSVTVTVHNTTGQAVTPHFMVTIGSGHPDGFWFQSHHRPVVVQAGGTVTVTLFPPDWTFAPTHGTQWIVQAYTSTPHALSVSPLQFWKLGKP
jgi:uncharacterized membrane protein